MNYKPLFSRALGLDPERLHFAAHSHHLWPDVSFDGQVRTFEVADSDGVDGTVIAVGPAEVAYLTQGQFPDFWIVAVSLAPDRLGEVIGRWDADVNRFLEYPPMTFGHSDTGLFDRRFDDRPPIVPHIDSLGVPITSFDAPPVFSVEHDNGLGGLVTSSDGGRWMLAVDAAPHGGIIVTMTLPEAA